jgi:hypothetical protein
VGALRVGLERSADRLAAHGDGFNHHPGELLSVAILAPGFLLWSHFVHDDFRAAAVGHHLQRHTGIFDVGLAECGGCAVFHKQHVVELDRFINLGMDPVEVVVAIRLQPNLGA